MTRDELWYRAMELGAAAGCHQRPDRSFFLGDYQFPVCARCTGVFLGQSAAFAVLLAGRRPSAGISAALLAVMGADWLAQYAGLCESTNPRRLITGIMGGAGVVFLWARAVSWAINAMKNVDNG